MISSTTKCLRNDLVVFLYTIDASLQYEMGDIIGISKLSLVKFHETSFITYMTQCCYDQITCTIPDIML